MTNLLTILAIILALPMQMAGFHKALRHLDEHRVASHVSSHEHSHGHAHSHSHDHEPSEAEHDHDQQSNASDEHSHGDGTSPHSHAKDLSLTFLQSGSPRVAISFEIKPTSTALTHVFEHKSSPSRQSHLSLLRPPIAA